MLFQSQSEPIFHHFHSSNLTITIISMCLQSEGDLKHKMGKCLIEQFQFSCILRKILHADKQIRSDKKEWTVYSSLQSQDILCQLQILLSLIGEQGELIHWFHTRRFDFEKAEEYSRMCYNSEQCSILNNQNDYIFICFFIHRDFHIYFNV